MSHLNDETLARLVDDPPASLEAAHLAECDACRAQLDALRADARALAALGGIEPPAHAWDALQERLVGEGLIRTHRRSAWPALLRLAAALALFLTGTLAGFAWRGATLPPALAASEGVSAQPDATTPGVAAPAATGQVAGEPEPGAASARTMPADANERNATAAPTMPAPAAAGPANVASAADEAADARAREDMGRPAAGEPRITGPLPRAARFAGLEYAPRNAQEAATLLRDAEGLYLDALAQYAQHAGAAPDAGDPLARLVALESIVLTTREALDHAPADPIINGYHMTAVAQREATLRQIAATSRSPWF